MKKSILGFCILTNLVLGLEANDIQNKVKEKEEEIILEVNFQNNDSGENSVISHESAHAEEKK